MNAQGALSLIRCKPGKLSETYGPHERCLRFVTAFMVRTDRKSKLQTEPVLVYWTCVRVVQYMYIRTVIVGESNLTVCRVGTVGKAFDGPQGRVYGS